MEKFRVHVCAFTAITLSGEVQSEHSTEENTCMTSSVGNRVSIPPKRSGIGLSDDRSCVSPQKLAFLSVVLCKLSAGNRHRYIKPDCIHCQILFKITGSLCFSCSIIMLNLTLQFLDLFSRTSVRRFFKNLRINRNLIQYPVLPWTVYSNFNYSLQSSWMFLWVVR